MSRTKRSSWGAVQEVSRGKWRIRYRADLGDGRGYTRHSLTLHGTRREADRRLAELRAEHDGGTTRRVAPTFRQLWERDVWPDVQSSVAENTRLSYATAWRKVEAKWGDVRVDAVNGAMVQDWLVSELTRKMGVNALLVMRKVTNQAYLLGYLDRDPLAAKIKVSTARKTPPERTELDLMPYFAACRADSPELYFGVVLMAAGGCRVGEALAVRADSVAWDGSRATFEVADQASENSSSLAGRVKNEHSSRTASVPGSMGAELAEWASGQLERGLTYVVDRGDGKPVSKSRFRERMRLCLERSGLEWVTPRSLRRSFATATLDAGAGAGPLNLSMGHTRDSRTLFTAYDRPSAKNAPVIPSAWDDLGRRSE